MGNRCRMSNTVSQPSAAPLFAEEKIPDTYNRIEMQRALTKYAATDLKQDSKQLPKAAGEGALFQRSLERIIPSGEVQLNLASHDCIIHKQAVQDVLVHQRGLIFRNGLFSRTCVVSQVVQTDHLQSQSVNIVGDLPDNFKVQLGSQDRLYITASYLTKDRVIQFEKTAGSSARMTVIIGDRSVSSATFKDGVGKFEFADGGSLTVKGLQEPSDLIVTDNKATAAAGQFKDIGLFAEKVAQLNYENYSPSDVVAPSAPAPAPTPLLMKEETGKNPVAPKGDPFAEPVHKLEQGTAAPEKTVTEQTVLLKKTEGALAKSDTALTAAQAENTALKGEVDKLQKQAAETALQNSRANTSANAALLAVKNKDAEIQKLKADNKIAETARLGAQQDLAKVKNEVKEFQSQTSKELTAIKAALDSAQTNYTVLASRWEQTNKELLETRPKLAAADTRAKNAEANLKSAKEALSDSSKETEAAKSKTEKAESQVKDLTKALDAAKTNEQSAKLDAEKLRQDLADKNKKHLEDLKAEKAKTKEESTKAESAAATAKGTQEALTKQLNTVQGELSAALTKLKEKPPVGQPKPERLSATLADVDTDTKDKDAKIALFISDVADPAIKKLLQELLEKNQENKYLRDAVHFLALSNSPKIMAQVQQILVGDLTPAEQKEYLAHLTYGPGGVEGYESYSAYFHQLGARQKLLMDIIDNEPGMSKEGKEKAKKLYDDMSTEYARKCLKEFNDAAAAKKKAVENK